MSKELSITLIGSFKKDPAALKALFKQLSLEYTILSPTTIDWINPDEEFLRAGHESEKSVKDIEEGHLEAVRNSDFTVLVAPDGYVGLSGSLEVGFAHALGIPVIATQPVNDPTIAAMVDGILGETTGTIDYGRGLKALQTHYATIAKRNGWDKESARDTMLLLTEEVGELARAVRKHEGLKREGKFDTQLSEELADVQIYLAHLANTVDIDLADSVTEKIMKNEKKNT